MKETFNNMYNNLKYFALFIFLVNLPENVKADYSISRFTNTWCGTSYPTDYVTGSWSITETEINGNNGMNGLSKNQTNNTLIIDLPAGFEFKTTGYIATITATGVEITNISFVFNSATQIIVTLTTSSVNAEFNTLNFNNFEIRATAETSGNILRNGGTFKIDNDAALPSSSESFGQLSSSSPFSYTGSTVIHPVASTDSITQYSINNQILRIQITGTGNCSGDVTAFYFNTDGANETGTDSIRSISKAKLYFTGTSTAFSTTNFFGSYDLPNGNFTITGSHELVAGSNYFFLTYDIIGDAYTGNDGNKVDAKLDSFVLNTVTKTDMTVSAPTGYRVIKPAKYYYSSISGNWGTNSTWSLTDNGLTCNCQPNGAGVVIIDTNHTVALNVERIVDVIEIHEGAILDGGATSKTLTINNYLKTFSTGKFTLSQELFGNQNIILSGSGSSSNSQQINNNGDLTIGTGTRLSANGSIIIGGNLLVNGTLDGSGTVTMNGGSCTLSGAGTISNSSRFIITNGDKTIPASANLTIVPDFYINGNWKVTNNGIVTISGNLDGTSELSNWTNAAGSTLNYGGTLKMFISGGEFLSSAILSTVNFNGSGAQNIFPPDNLGQFYHLTLSGEGEKTLTGDVKIKGNFRNNTAFNHNGKNVTMNGDVAQTINGNSVTAFNTLTVDNSSTGIILNQSININATIVLTNSNINLNGYNITLCPTCYVSGESNTGRIYGTSGYIQITQDINAPNSLNPGNLGAILTSESNLGSTNIKRGHAAAASPLGYNGIKRYYDITPTVNTGLNATLRFYYLDNELNGQTEENFYLYKSTDGGENWLAIGASAADYSNNYVEQSGIGGFSRWTVSNNLIYPLPVELLSFSGIYEKENVSLYWETSSETNNDYYTIERSEDLESFELIVIVDGAGNSNTIHSYSVTDAHPPSGIVYYRLKQTDFDGMTRESDIISVNVENNIPGISFSHLYFNDNYIGVTVNGGSETNIFVSIYDILGKEFYSECYKTENNSINLSIEAGSLSKGGVYFLKVFNSEESIVKKFILE